MQGCLRLVPNLVGAWHCHAQCRVYVAQPMTFSPKFGSYDLKVRRINNIRQNNIYIIEMNNKRGSIQQIIFVVPVLESMHRKY